MLKIYTKTVLGLMAFSLATVTFASNSKKSIDDVKGKVKDELVFTENKGQVSDQNHNPRPDVLFSGTNDGLVYHLRNNGVSYQLNHVDSWKSLAEMEGRSNNAPANFQVKVPFQTTVYRLDMNWNGINKDFVIVTQNQKTAVNNYFYVTGARSDYLKAMARRIRVYKEDVPLFLFYVRVKGFYRLTPNFLIRWDTSAPENPAADFSAVIWYKEGLGGVGNVERGGLIPPLATNQLESVYFKYGEYRQELMFGTEIAGETDANRLGFVKALWELASTKNYPKFEDVKHFGKIATL